VAICAVAALAPAAQAGTFPGTDGRIAYRSFVAGPGGGDITTVDPSGANPLGLTSGSAFDDRPSYSADGERIAFDRALGMADPDIWVMNHDGSDQTALTTGGNGRDPSFSPDGSRIAFARTVEGQDEIFVMNADGGDVTRLTNNAVNDFGPEFSPDGSRIAFSRGNAADNEIHVMGSGGENPTPLTSLPLDARSPKWSPDGRQIVFGACEPASCRIFVVAADGGSPPAQLTFGPGFQEIPAFSPDGSLITFSNDGPLAVMNSDGTGIHNITSGLVDTFPDWQPLNPPALDVTVEKQKSTKAVIATIVSQNENATATLDGSLKAPKPKAAASKKKTVELDAVTVQLQPGVPVTVEIPVAGKGKKLIKKALRAGKKPKGTLTATATDDLGASESDTADVKYKKRKKK
jgi:Tol biopolymer transport system component